MGDLNGIFPIKLSLTSFLFRWRGCVYLVVCVDGSFQIKPPQSPFFKGGGESTLNWLLALTTTQILPTATAYYKDSPDK